MRIIERLPVVGEKISTLQAIRRENSEQSETWRKARQVMEEEKGRESIIRLAASLREKGDLSAVVFEFLPGWNPKLNILELR